MAEKTTSEMAKTLDSQTSVFLVSSIFFNLDFGEVFFFSHIFSLDFSEVSYFAHIFCP